MIKTGSGLLRPNQDFTVNKAEPPNQISAGSSLSGETHVGEHCHEVRLRCLGGDRGVSL
jgi:hypothetical protein